jgi:AcrR family transcriptional regulator
MVHKLNVESNLPSVTQRRKDREKSFRQQEIFQAAEKIFAKRGFQGATIVEIAAEAELSVGTIYNFFESKEKLYSEIITQRLDEMRQEVLGKVEGIQDIRQRLRKILLVQAAFIEKNRDFFIIFLRDQNRFPWTLAKDFGKEVAARYDHYLESLTGIFMEGIQEGIFNPFDPADMAEALAGMCNAFFYKWLLEKPDWTLKSKGLKLYKMFMDGVEKK